MRQQLSDTLSALYDCANRIGESATLTRQQQDDLQSIKSLGENLVNYLENAEREITSLKQRIKQLYQTNRDIDSRNEDEIYTLLALMSARLRQSIDIDELLDAVTLETNHLLQSDQVIVYQLGDQNDRPIQYESVNDFSRSLLGQSLPSIYTDSEWLESYQRCLSRVVDDITVPECDPKITASLFPLGIYSAIAVAIPSSKKLWGLLIVHQYDSSRYWQAWEIELLEKLGTQLAISIHQMQLLVSSDNIRRERDQVIAQLLHSQLHDSLTGLPNRDSFMKSLDVVFRENRELLSALAK